MDETSIIELIPQIIKKCKEKAKEIIADSSKVSYTVEKITKSSESNNMFYHSDNIKAMNDLLCGGYSGKIDLIYIDPPFLTMADYKSRIEVLHQGRKESINYFAYNDIWKDGLKEYLEMLTIRLFLMKELLSDRGSIYVHLDFRAVHYVKIIMDSIFSSENFLNEIIWAYKSGGSSNRHFSRKHDNILVYTKTSEYIFNPQKEKSYNRGFKPYGFKNVMEYQDQIGWYTLVNLKDVWNIDMVGRTSKERVGYMTQKPETLLERIIKASSLEGSIVADFFGGSGTTAIVAEKYNRQWILSDKGKVSGVTIRKRLGENAQRSYTIHSDEVNEYKSALTINNISVKENSANQSLIQIILGKYDLDLGSIKMSKRHRELVLEIMESDSLAFIDYIGLLYKSHKNSEVNLGELYRTTDKLRIDNTIEFHMDNKNQNRELYLKVIDIFGNVLYKQIDFNKH